MIRRSHPLAGRARPVGVVAMLVVGLIAVAVPASVAASPVRATAAVPRVSASARLTAVVAHDSESDCLDWVTAPSSVGDALKAAVCSDVVSDLAGIGSLLGLPIIVPSSHSWNDPVQIIFSTASNGTTLMQTSEFKAIKSDPLGNNNKGFIDEPCQITLYPISYDGEAPVGSGVSDRLHVLLSHEVVHCYQNEDMPAGTNTTGTDIDGNTTGTIAEFINEGSATYLGTLYAGYGEPATPLFWQNGWIGNPTKDLTARGYDAVGWYSLLAKINGDLWPKMAAAWKIAATQGSAAYITALGGDNPAVEQAWAPSIVNQPDWGDGWSTPGIGVPEDAHPTYVSGTIDATGGSNGRSLGPWSALFDQETQVPDGIVEVNVTGGYGSIHDSSDAEYMGFTNKEFCVGQKACTDTDVSCAAGAPPIFLPRLNPPFTLAVSAGADGGNYTISSIPSPSTPTTPVVLPSADGTCTPPSTSTTTGYSEGDPHLQTLNGGDYDFQGAGEYTLVRSTTGDLDVQIRQQPSLFGSVAWDTAVAMLVSGTRVEVDPGTRARILVNGRSVSLSGTSIRHLNGGGELYFDRQGDVIVKWPDGSKADVFVDLLGENVTFTAGSDRVGSLVGLLAAVKGTGSDNGVQTFLGGNGKHWKIDEYSTSGFKTLYRDFGPSWLITQRQSLFTYAKGKNTRSYDISSFPGRAFSFASIPAGQYAGFEATCRKSGITNEQLLRDCIEDLKVSGKDFVATATAHVDAVVTQSSPTATLATTPPAASTTTSSTTTTSTTTTTTTPGVTAPVTIPLGPGGSLPVIAFDPVKSDATYVAWANTKGTGIDLCVVIASGSCNPNGKPYLLTDPLAGTTTAAYSDPAIVIMPTSYQVVVVADIDDLPDANEAKIDPALYDDGADGGDVAWASPPGGAAFGQSGQGLQNGGKFLATGVPPEAGAVALGPTTIGVFNNDTYESSFADFNLTTPAPAVPAVPNPGSNFAQAAGSDSSQVAALPATLPAGDDLVVGVAMGSSLSSCPDAETNVGWGSATGSLSATSTSGALNDSASWSSKGFTLLACAAEDPATVQGTSGIGEIDQEGSKTINLVYRSFDPTSDSFASPVTISNETNVSDDGADNIAVSEDTAGWIYVTWQDMRGQVVSYSSDGGSSWTKPVATGLSYSTDDQDYFVIDGMGSGRFDLAYNETGSNGYGEHEVLTQFNYAELAKAKPTNAG